MSVDAADPGRVHGPQDSCEWSNLADNPECAAVRDRLTRGIGDWRESAQDPLLDPADCKKKESKGN